MVFRTRATSVGLVMLWGFQGPAVSLRLRKIHTI